MYLEIIPIINYPNFFSLSGRKTELEQAEEICAQIIDSLDWLSYIYRAETDTKKREQLSKEIDEAYNQYNRIDKAIRKHMEKSSV